MFRIAAAAVVTLLVLTGCESVPPAYVAKHQKLQAIPSKSTDTKTLYLANVTDQIMDKKMGQAKGGLLCIGGTDLTWRNNPAVISPMQQAMANELEKNGYRVYSGLIQSRGQSEADVLIGVGLKEVKANMCSSIDGFKGDIAMTLTWEIFDSATKKTLTLTTSGSSSADTFSRTGDPDLYIDAARMAATNLLASREFYDFTRK